MLVLATVLNTLSACNLYLCLYGAFGAALLWRSLLAKRDNRHDVAHEDAVIGLFHVALALVQH